MSCTTTMYIAVYGAVYIRLILNQFCFFYITGDMHLQ